MKLSSREAGEVLKKFNASKLQLPCIKKKDPGLSGLEVKKGDVIKIIRREDSGETVYYRVVL